MGRARAGALAGALRSVVDHGTQGSTMSGIAQSGRVAKATLYNHFRTKEEVWAALVADEVAGLAVLAADAPIADRLAAVAGAIAAHPALERLRSDEPQSITRLCAVGEGESWVTARAYLADAIGADPSAADVDVLLRWLVSHIAAPGDAHSRHAGALLLAEAVSRTDAAAAAV
jgi:AcrR family transcriptional regulator